MICGPQNNEKMAGGRGLPVRNSGKADDRTEGRVEALVEISSALRGNTDPELVELFERVASRKGIIQDDALFICDLRLSFSYSLLSRHLP